MMGEADNNKLLVSEYARALNTSVRRHMERQFPGVRGMTDQEYERFIAAYLEVLPDYE